MTEAAAQLNRELKRLKGAPPIVGGMVLQRIIGAGGMGIVYEGTHLRLRIPVAVKFLYDDPNNKEHIARFVSEAALSARINSPYVVRVYDVNKDGAFQYIVQEYVVGQTADQLMREAVIAGKPLSESQVLHVAADAARGLAAIHAVEHLHLDIKPDNLMITANDHITKILDFGLAQPFDPRDIPGSIPDIGKMPVDGGTPGYASPEQLKCVNVGPSSDIYSLGVTIFELMSGHRAFTAVTWDDACTLQNECELPNIRTIRPEISTETAELLAKCVKIDAPERFQSAMELLSAISNIFQARISKSLPGSMPPTRKTLSIWRDSQNTQNAELSNVGPLIFCVDDDETILELMKNILGLTHCRVEVFNDGIVFLKRMQVKLPDLVFLDIEMPIINGLKLLSTMRADETMAHIPVVFLTGSASIEYLHTALYEGATDYLIKPIQTAEVLARVQCLTRISRARQELERLEGEFKSFHQRLSTMTGRKQV